MTVLQTDRLTLRPLIAADAELYAGMRYHPDVAKWLSPSELDPIDAARAAIERFELSWQERRYAPWGLFRDGRLIGHGGLNFVPEFEATEVLWALHPDAWGRGYATEMARAALRFGFETVGLASIFAITKPDNTASQAVMKRLGLRYRKNVVYRNLDSVWFDVSRETFEKIGEKTA
ncbi:MAG: GNAT family N-acetyltransferase [Proteobacteria bacterium]|nr:GNAT family N-acetyltransferase [Pseudomonadota bacterium]